MGDGYTRQSTAAIAANEVIRAAPFNLEFNTVEDAFNGTTGHAHDGTLGNGPKIVLTSGNGVSGALPVANGGTNATTAADARTNLGLAIGTNVQAYDAELAAIAALAGTGFVSHTGAGTAAERSLTGTAGEIDITNPAGISGNPVFSLPATVVLTGKNVTGGTFTSPAITGGSVAGITDLAVADGGTGASTAADARTNLGISTVGATGDGADLIAPIDDAAHGNLSGGTLHLEATTTEAGFMSPADKIKLDGISGTNPAGTVITYAAATAPTGYLVCDGALYSRVTYADLFAVIGTTFGVGDGTTTFGVPMLMGQFIRGWNSTGSGIDASRVFGSTQTDDFLAHTHTFTGTAVAAHTHTASETSAGSHNHSGFSTDAGGSHAHTGSTSASGDHTHTYWEAAAATNDNRQGANSGLDVMSRAAANTGGAGNHSHTFTTSTVAAHQHTVTTNTVAGHTHTITVNSGGAHTPAGTNSSTGGTETRPDNVALLFCIKT